MHGPTCIVRANLTPYSRRSASVLVYENCFLVATATAGGRAANSGGGGGQGGQGGARPLGLTVAHDFYPLSLKFTCDPLEYHMRV